MLFKLQEVKLSKHTRNPSADEMKKHKRQSGRAETAGTGPEFGMVVGRMFHLLEGHMDETRLRNTQLCTKRSDSGEIPPMGETHEEKKPYTTSFVYVGWRGYIVRHLD